MEKGAAPQIFWVHIHLPLLIGTDLLILPGFYELFSKVRIGKLHLPCLACLLADLCFF